MATLRTLFAIILMAALSYSEAANILLVPAPGKSHTLVFFAVGKALVQRGHHVYAALPDIEEDFAKDAIAQGIHPVTFKAQAEAFSLKKMVEDMFVNYFKGQDEMDLGKLSHFLLGMCEWMMDDQGFLDKVASLNIDLAFVDGLPVIPCQAILAAKFKIPYITIDTITFLARIPTLPSFVPLMLSPLTDRMTFRERLVNTFQFVFLQFYPVFPAWSQTALIEKHAKHTGARDWIDLLLKSEMLFSSRDSILEFPSPTMPHHATIACITCKPAVSLPGDLENFYSQAKNGVIVVSFGSLATGLPEFISNRMLDAFKLVNYHIIWRFIGTSEPKNIPDNIKLMKWMPQNDLLAHNNTVLFITHCGNNGHYESIYHGVPMVGFPIAGDQLHNAKRMTGKKIGVELNLQDFTADDLVKAINTVLGDKDYTKNARLLSAIMKDAPMNAQETAAYWTEHILKFGGSHLRSYALDMPLHHVLVRCFCCFYWYIVRDCTMYILHLPILL